jgi:hypothetical protein
MTRTAPPLKLTNLEQRTREHLLPGEVEAMLKGVVKSGWSVRIVDVYES